MTEEFVSAEIPSRKNFNDLTRRVFGNLTVHSFAGFQRLPNGHRQSHWNCVCSCGNKIHSLRHGNLTTGNTQSCGCLFKKIVTSHGLSGSSEYCVWDGMIQRCTNENSPMWDRYGARGITVHPEWIKSFQSWIEHVGPRPSMKHTIDRKDNNKGYVPGNVKWSTAKEQGRNKATNRMITFRGETKCLAEWAETLNMKFATLWARLHDGWDIEKALTTPVKKG